MSQEAAPVEIDRLVRRLAFRDGGFQFVAALRAIRPLPFEFPQVLAFLGDADFGGL